MTKQHTHKLTNSLPYRLIGIVTHMSNHQMLWLLNSELAIDFQPSINIVLKKQNAEPLNFPTYICDYSKELVYVLYANKTNNIALVKSNKSADYIIKCSGNTSDAEFMEFIRDIKNSDNIVTAFQIDNNQLRKSEKALLGER